MRLSSKLRLSYEGLTTPLINGIFLIAVSVSIPAIATTITPMTDQAYVTSQAYIEQAQRFEHAEGVVKDLPRALQLYCEAAKLGSADAFLRLGWMYANGRGVTRDDSTAATLFRKSASLGNEMAARLSDMIRGEREVLPSCLSTLGASAQAASEPAAQNRVVTASVQTTPQAIKPADFRKPPSATERKRFIELVLKLAPEFKLDPRLVLALINQESNFDPQATSPKNAQGLMQLIPETAARFGVLDAFDPLSNLKGGMAYLRWLLAYFKGDVALALAGYNAGEGIVEKFKGVPPYPETMAYVQRIRAVYPFDRHPFDKSLNVRISQNGTSRGLIPRTK